MDEYQNQNQPETSAEAIDELPKELEEQVDKKVKEIIGEDGGLGYCHSFWSVKKQILHDEYGIDWKSPAERYPTIIFD